MKYLHVLFLLDIYEKKERDREKQPKNSKIEFAFNSLKK